MMDENGEFSDEERRVLRQLADHYATGKKTLRAITGMVIFLGAAMGFIVGLVTLLTHGRG